MTYVRTCSRCHTPWDGFDFVCNSCRTLESINKQNEILRNEQNRMFRNEPLIDDSYYDNDDNLSQRDKDLGKPFWKR